VFGTLQQFLKYLITPYYADDVIEIPNSEREQVMENSITASESSASGRTTNVVIEVSTNDASSSKNNISFESSPIEVAIKDNVEISGLNKGLDGSDISETYSSSIEVCHLNASK
jgi:activating signal cointegrator complex subunit 1